MLLELEVEDMSHCLFVCLFVCLGTFPFSKFGLTGDIQKLR